MSLVIQLDGDLKQNNELDQELVHNSVLCTLTRIRCPGQLAPDKGLLEFSAACSCNKVPYCNLKAGYKLNSLNMLVGHWLHGVRAGGLLRSGAKCESPFTLYYCSELP